MKTAKISLSRIDKTALYEGKKGKYLDIVLWDKPNEYGDDGFVTQDIGRLRRESGEKGPIIGNWKETGKRTTPVEQKPPLTVVDADDHADDDIPF